MDRTASTESGAAAPGGEEVAGAYDGRQVFDVTIVGAGPSGLFGAFYAGMRNLSVKIIDALPEPGGQLAALYPEKYIYDAPGYPKIAAKDLVAMLVEQANQWSPTYCLGERVTGLRQLDDGTWELATEHGRHLSKAVVIAAGVGAFAPNRLNVPGIERFEGRSVHYFVRDKAAFRGKRILIVGGGDSAVDWGLNLQDVAKSITLIHRRDEFRAHESSVDELRSSEAQILTPYEVKSVEADGTTHQIVIYNNRTKEETTLEADVILVNIGFKADIGPIREWGLELDKRGIAVNSRMETNLPGVFAAGDIAAEEVKMNLIAMGYAQAALAVNVAKNYIDPKAKIFPGHSSEQM